MEPSSVNLNEKATTSICILEGVLASKLVLGGLESVLTRRPELVVFVRMAYEHDHGIIDVLLPGGRYYE